MVWAWEGMGGKDYAKSALNTSCIFPQGRRSFRKAAGGSRVVLVTFVGGALPCLRNRDTWCVYRVRWT